MNKKAIIYTLICTLVLLSFKSNAHTIRQAYEEAVKRGYQDHNAEKKMLEQLIPQLETSTDTATIFDVKFRLMTINSGEGNYFKAYEIGWSLLPLVANSNYIVKQVDLYARLSSMYTIFEQYDKSDQYLSKAIDLTTTHNIGQHYVATLYAMKAWLNTKAYQDFPTALEFLIKSVKLNTSVHNKAGIVYSKMQLAELYTRMDSLHKAQVILNALEKQHKKPSIAHSLLFDHMGQLQMKLLQYDSAVYYFHKCIDAIDRYKNHLDNKVEVLDSMASCYHYLGKNDSAYYYTQMSAQVSNDLFGSKSGMNKELFEIKNMYEERLKAHQLELLQQEKQVLRLKTFMYLSVLIVIIIGLAVLITIRSRKMSMLKQRQEQEKKAQQARLETKNRELTASTLKLLERDALLNDIRNSLDSMKFKEENQQVISALTSSIKANKAKNWDEFEIHFTSVNNAFYENLKRTYPTLSATDLKMCALIKLGLSSKEMADVMAIEKFSVNTSRSRIRKKMGLSREVNLIEHLQSIG